MNRRAVFIGVLTVCCMNAFPQTDALKDLGANIQLPTVEAGVSVGFNYDFLRSPTAVSFDRQQAFFGFNVPVGQTLNLRSLSTIAPAMDEMFSDSTLINNGDEFNPRAGAHQSPNISIMIDVPMLGGVGSFSNLQNFFLNYQTTLGNPNLFLHPNLDSSGIDFLMRGTFNVPISMQMSWETMTFGYAFKFNKYLTVAANLSRHVFVFDLRAKVDADLLGRYKVDLGDAGLPPVEGELDYPSEKIHGTAYGYYDVAAWSPTLSMKLWRLSVTSRFGINARAKGSITAKYSLPFFIDPETFQMFDFTDVAAFTDPDFLVGMQTNATDSLSYTTTKTVNGRKQESDLQWKMPTGVTFDFEIIRNHLMISYTKLYGEVGMKIDRISKVKNTIQGETVLPVESDSTIFDMGISVDHVMLSRLSLWGAYGTLGAFAMDFRYGERDNILGSAMSKVSPVMLGNAALIPIVNLGTVLGTKWKLLFELDILPLPALRSGVFYYF